MARPSLTWLRSASLPVIILALGGLACSLLILQMLVVAAMALAG